MKILFRILSGLAIVVLALLVTIYAISYYPDDIQKEVVFNNPESPVLQPGQSLKILNWNIQFFAGNKNNHFFFDNGKDTWPAEPILNDILQKTADIIIAENPDVILLQEVDDGAARTYYHDQLDQLLKLLPKEYQNHTSSFYWKSAFIPHPAIMGKVGMKISTISKYQISSATRHALSPITNQNWVIKQGNPRRAILQAELPVQGSNDFHILNTHLSAFAQGSDTMERQIKQVKTLMDNISEQGHGAILGGDFNLVPSQHAFAALPEKYRAYYNPTETEITPLITNYGSVPSLEQANSENAAAWFTHAPNSSKDKVPNKTLDYYFYNQAVTLNESYVRYPDTRWISDHMPVIATFTVPKK